jgi:hypothetical protein
MSVTSYTALHLTEIEKDGNIDSKMIILFHETEQNYYLYGTRRDLKSGNGEKLNYEYVYHYSRLSSLISLIECLTNKLNKKNMDEYTYNVEIHNIYIYDEEYPYLDYFYLIEKFSKHNEMVAYDDTLLDDKLLKKILKILTSSY